MKCTSFRSAIFLLLLSSSLLTHAQLKLSTPNVESILYLGTGKKQPLIVAFGGSEGGNAWTSDRWKKIRDGFIQRGYAFLAIGYFGAKGTPDTLNKIAIDGVYAAIKTAAKHKGVNRKKIAVIGGSRGADLALLLGSYYKDIDCVVGLMASSAVFPGHTQHFSTSCWTYQNEELPFIPVNEAAVPHLMKRNLRASFEAMLKDTAAAEKAAIKVEKINGPVLLLSATKDEVCPSTPMAESIVQRLQANNFKFHFEHKAIEGGHAAPLKHFDLVMQFLEEHFLKSK